MNNARSCAQSIEHIIRKAFDVDDRSTIGGFTESDCIIDHPFWSMISTLTYLYGCRKIGADALENFYDTFEFTIDYSIDEVLSFNRTSGKVNGDFEETEFETGEEALDAMEEAFSRICG